VGGIGKCHRTKGCCTWCIHVGKQRVLDHQLHLFYQSCLQTMELNIDTYIKL
jgi:hypothetical protein